MGICAEVRRHCREIAESSELVRIDLDRLGDIEPGPPAELDRERHYLDGPPEDVATYILTLDSINFGSGWFPTLRKRPGCSGYYTIAWALADRFRAHGPWSNDELRTLSPDAVAHTLEQDRGHELMLLYAQALNQLGDWLGDRRALDVVGPSAETLAEHLIEMPFFDDKGFWKRAQITANDLALAGVATFPDLDELTIFADNLVPHVLRVDGVLHYDPQLADRIDRGDLLEPGGAEREIRAAAVHACELIAPQLGVPPRILDTWLWDRGQEPRYKAVPRHRTRCVWY